MLERVHGDGSDEGDVHAEPAMRARAVEADEGSELGRGLVARGSALNPGWIQGEG